MPWLPDFVSAAELARRGARVEGRTDPVGQYLRALSNGDPHALQDAWPGKVVVYDPRAGEVRGNRQLRRLVSRSHELLSAREARVETVAATAVTGRAVVEMLIHIADERDGGTAWPLAVVADSPDDASVVFRAYFSRRPLEGQRFVRPAILEAGAQRPPDVVGKLQAALAAGDAAAAADTFTPDGYLREPAGPDRTHRGQAALRAYFEKCGGIVHEDCAVTDDGVRCAVEYNCVRWGGREVPPQAGLAIYERGADGLLAAARIYDDVE